MTGEADMGGKNKGRPDLAPSPNKTGPNYIRATFHLPPLPPVPIFAPHVRNSMSDGGRGGAHPCPKNGHGFPSSPTLNRLLNYH